MGADRLVYVRIDEGASIELEDAQVDKSLSEKVHRGLDHVLMIDMRKVKSISKDARSYYAKPMEESNIRTKAVAIVVSSPISRVLGNFFMGTNRPVVPARMFNTVEAAIEWLQPFLGSFLPQTPYPESN
jgi:hypothetical protein